VEQQTEMRPALKTLDMPTKQLDRYEEMLGVSAASLFLASELNLPLYLDDVGLSQLAASSEWQVQGVSTLTVLTKMKSRGLMSAIEHCEALKTLVLANCIVVPVNTEQLVWMCESEGKKATQRMKRILLRTMQGPEWEETSAVRVAAQFMYKMWLGVVDVKDKLDLLDAVIEALISGRDAARVRTRFKSELSRTFVYLKRALVPIYAHIDASDESNEDSELTNADAATVS
jgi:hypothetical protein